MSKIILWKDNDTPPTNYLWMKKTPTGQIEGIYEHNGDTWVKISTGGTGDGVPITTTPNQIYATDLNGNQITIEFSKNPIQDTVVIRDSKGAVKTAMPQDPDDAVPLRLFSWIDA